MRLSDADKTVINYDDVILVWCVISNYEGEDMKKKIMQKRGNKSMQAHRRDCMVHIARGVNETCDFGIKVSASGKLVLCGEHAVMHGYPCISFAINQRLYTKIKYRKDDKIIVNSDKFGRLVFSLHEKVVDIDINSHWARSIYFLVNRLARSGLEIDIKSDIDDCGFGSSGALFSCVCCGLLLLNAKTDYILYGKTNFITNELADEAIKADDFFSDSNRLCKDTICKKKILNEKLFSETIKLYNLYNNDRFDGQRATFKNIKPSGVDIATSIFGGLIYYNPKTKSVDNLSHEWLDGIGIAVIYTGYKTSTETTIKIANDVKNCDEIYKKISNIIDNIKDKIVAISCATKISKRAGDKIEEIEILHLLKENHSLLRKLNLTNDDIDRIISFCERRKVFAKISGSGLGDCVIAFDAKDKIDNIVCDLNKIEIDGNRNRYDGVSDSNTFNCFRDSCFRRRKIIDIDIDDSGLEYSFLKKERKGEKKDEEEREVFFDNKKNSNHNNDLCGRCVEYICNNSTQDEKHRKLTKQDIVNLICKKVGNDGRRDDSFVKKESTIHFAPTNIAIIKYWGKRDEELKLPTSSSLAITSTYLGTTTRIVKKGFDRNLFRKVGTKNLSKEVEEVDGNIEVERYMSFSEDKRDDVYLNGELAYEKFTSRVANFLNLFRNAFHIENIYFIVDTHNNFPVASGLASSASGFGALTLAINDIFNLNLSQRELSILARLGSGSASRSVVCQNINIATNNNICLNIGTSSFCKKSYKKRFVIWHKGKLKNGMDSFAESVFFDNCRDRREEHNIGERFKISNTDNGSISKIVDDLEVIVLILSSSKKIISSTEAMSVTIEKSKRYRYWLKQTKKDIVDIFNVKTFAEFGDIVENNSLTMHESIRETGINYFNDRTTKAIRFVKKCRKNGLQVYTTIDAGANVVLLCQKWDKKEIVDLLLSNNIVSKDEILSF